MIKLKVKNKLEYDILTKIIKDNKKICNITINKEETKNGQYVIYELTIFNEVK